MDFLSNGFHQLYSELDDEFSIWNYTASSSPMSKNVQDLNINRTNVDYYSFVENRESFELVNFLTNDYGKTFEPFTSDYENSLDGIGVGVGANVLHVKEQDWENAFLENFIEIPELTDFLPERTPLCNDSCNIFLKESSDNLKFRPTSIQNRQSQEGEISSNYDNRTSTSSCETESGGDKLFPCTFGTCTKVYAKPAHLKAHIRRHLGDKPYVCTWPNCTWKFSRSDELARHRRSHSGVKPYKCTYCTKCFSRSDHLAKHRKVHERKLAANKLKGIILACNLQQVKPGRKPKENKTHHG